MGLLGHGMTGVFEPAAMTSMTGVFEPAAMTGMTGALDPGTTASFPDPITLHASR